MRVFELHFNPKNKKDAVSESYIYEPEGPEGSLYMAGEMAKLPLKSGDFLDSLASVIKDGFYAGASQRTGEASLREALRKANDFLNNQVKKENVVWMGNLNFAVLAFKDSVLNFTKVGEMKILLIRGEEIVDISQNLEMQDLDLDPTKVFGNVASGKLYPQDRILILSKGVFPLVSKDGSFLRDLGSICEEKEIKRFLKTNRKNFSELSGICLLLIADQKKISNFFPNLKKKLFLLPFLFLILVSAHLLFKEERTESEINAALFKEQIEQSRSKMEMAENFLIIKNKEKAESLLSEALRGVKPIAEKKCPFQKEALELQREIESRLADIR